jgi:flagellar M-ring protein FliF
MREYWNALGKRQRLGLAAGATVLLMATAAMAGWLLYDPFIPLSGTYPAERQAAVLQALEHDKIAYRLAQDGQTVLVPASAEGKARVAIEGGTGLPPAAGLEIFKETDFSTTDFAQRVNYQRALQGELTRTLQTIAGVRTARVHVILPESSLLKRAANKASVAVTLQLQPGHVLAPGQVLGIQRLVASSVPELQANDVVVLDDTGRVLSRAAAGNAEGGADVSSAQLEMKRQADGYLESKLAKLLADLAPGARASLSVDATLDFKQLKVTTEEPIASTGGDADRPAGVLLRERQSQRGTPDTPAPNSTSAGTSDWDYEYSVGKRVEQSLSGPGAIRRISVAVALHGAPEAVTAAAVQQLVEHGIGIDRTRGDSVAVVMLPSVPVADAVPLSDLGGGTAAPVGLPDVRPAAVSEPRERSALTLWPALTLLATLLVLAAAIAWAALGRRPRLRRVEKPAIDLDQATLQVRAWLQQGGVRQ